MPRNSTAKGEALRTEMPDHITKKEIIFICVLFKISPKINV